MTLSYSNKKTIKKYESLIKGKKPWSKIEIHYFAKLVRQALWDRRKPKDLTDYAKEKLRLWELFVETDRERAITKEQTNIGLEWLKRSCFKTNGKPRENKTVQSMSLIDFETIKNFKKFTFIGYHFHYSHCYANLVSPVYRVYDKKGNYFDYTVAGQWGPMLIDSEIQLND